jgi:hypothetical protein
MKRIPSGAAFFLSPWCKHPWLTYLDPHWWIPQVLGNWMKRNGRAPGNVPPLIWPVSLHLPVCAVSTGNNIILERQRPELIYRRARMLLAGLGLLDINRLIEFRDPVLKSLEGRAQGFAHVSPRVAQQLVTIIQWISVEYQLPLENLG